LSTLELQSPEDICGLLPSSRSPWDGGRVGLKGEASMDTSVLTVTW